MEPAERYETPTFELRKQIEEAIGSARVIGKQSRPVLQPGSSRAREAAALLADFREEPAHDVWRALASMDERASIKQPRPDPRAKFLLMSEMGRTTKETMELAHQARLQFPEEWRRVRDLLASLPQKIELLRALMTWMPRDAERRAMLVDLNEIGGKFCEWFDELAPPIHKGAPRAAEVDPARRFAGWVFAALSHHGFTKAALLDLVNESTAAWKPAPISEARLRELRKGRQLRDLVSALVREGQAMREK